MYFGSLVAYVILIVLNLGIIYEATRYARSRRQTNVTTATVVISESGTSRKKKAEMTRTILFITFLYIILAFPSAILTGYYYNALIVLDIGPMLITLVDNIQFSYPAFNFFILYFSNKVFAKEVKRLFWPLQMRITQVGTSTHVRTNTFTENRNMTVANKNFSANNDQ